MVRQGELCLVAEWPAAEQANRLMELGNGMSLGSPRLRAQLTSAPEEVALGLLVRHFPAAAGSLTRTVLRATSGCGAVLADIV